MISLNKKISNNFFVKLSLTFLIILYFYFNLDFSLFKNTLNLFNFHTFYICLIILSISPFLFTLRWFYVVHFYQKDKLLNFYIQISKGLFLSELLQNSTFLDLYKFYKLKKINYKKKFFLIVNEKIIILFTRLFFLLFLITFVNFLFFKIYIFWHIIFLIFLILIFFIVFINLKSFKNIFFLKLFYNYYLNFFSKKIISRKKIFYVELFRNIILSLVYFTLSINFLDFHTALIITLLGPLVELILKVQFISVVGLRELIFYLIGSSTSLGENILISISIIISILFMITNILNYLISWIISFKTK